MLIAQLFLLLHCAPYVAYYTLCCNQSNMAMIATQVLLIDSHRVLILGKTLNNVESEVASPTRHKCLINLPFLSTSLKYHEQSVVYNWSYYIFSYRFPSVHVNFCYSSFISLELLITFQSFGNMYMVYSRWESVQHLNIINVFSFKETFSSSYSLR